MLVFIINHVFWMHNVNCLSQYKTWSLQCTVAISWLSTTVQANIQHAYPCNCPRSPLFCLSSYLDHRQTVRQTVRQSCSLPWTLASSARVNDCSFEDLRQSAAVRQLGLLSSGHPETLVLYTYSNSDPEYERNLHFFVQYGMAEGDGCNYVIIVQEVIISLCICSFCTTHVMANLQSLESMVLKAFQVTDVVIRRSTGSKAACTINILLALSGRVADAKLLHVLSLLIVKAHHHARPLQHPLIKLAHKMTERVCSTCIRISCACRVVTGSGHHRGHYLTCPAMPSTSSMITCVMTGGPLAGR